MRSSFLRAAVIGSVLWVAAGTGNATGFHPQ